MLKPATTLVALAMAVPLAAQSKAPPPVSHQGDRPARPGPASNFTGKVTVEALVNPSAPGRAALGLVTFSPGARSHWHTHPAGQSLYVTDGCGWTQREGGKIERICKGDVAYVPAGVRHWHGATNRTAMSHISVSESIDGRNVEWAEPVSDAQYLAGRSARR